MGLKSLPLVDAVAPGQPALLKSFTCASCGTRGSTPLRSRRKYCVTCADDAAKARRRRHYEANREQIIARAAEWKRANPEKVAGYTADRYARRRDQMKAATERWRRNNPDKVRDIREARRARERNAFVEPVSRVEIWEAHGGRCGICQEPVELGAMELDHIVPLSRGGLHERGNCQPAHRTCNRRKFNKLEAQRAEQSA